MRRTPGRLPSLTRRVAALSSTRGCDRGESRAYVMSIGGEYGEYGYVESGGATPLYRGFPVGLASMLESTIGSDIFGLGDELPGRGKLLKICPDIIVNFLKFVDMCRKFWAVL